MITSDLKRSAKKKLLTASIIAKAFGMPSLAAGSLRLMKIDFDNNKVESGISVCRYKYGCEAASCISIDFDHPRSNPENAALNRIGTIAVTELAERYRIPLTWAICGEAAIKDKEAFRRIISSDVEHDIGVHTYSHRDLSDPACTERDLVSEILRCIEVLNDVRRPSTFIFPWNREAYLESLGRLGFVSYRPKDRRLGYPFKKDGVWSIPPVYYLDGNSAGASELVERFIDFAVEYGCVFHLWFHPWSIADEGDVDRYLSSTLEPIFRYIDENRRDGRVWVCTMRELANYCEARERCLLSTHQKNGGIEILTQCHISDQRFDFPPQLTFQIPIPHYDVDVRVEGEEAARESIRASSFNGDLRLFLTLSYDSPVRKVEVSF